MGTHHSPRWLIVLTIPLAVAACSNGTPDSNGLTAPSSFTGPGPFGPPAPFRGRVVVPATIPFASIGGFGCPAIAPFTINFPLFVDQRLGVDVFLHEVTFGFMDTSSLVTSQVFSRSSLMGTFETTLVPAGSTRNFVFATGFGCGFRAAPHSVSVRVKLQDRQGAFEERTATAGLSVR
jgi:hypothetical protein